MQRSTLRGRATHPAVVASPRTSCGDPEINAAECVPFNEIGIYVRISDKITLSTRARTKVYVAVARTGLLKVNVSCGVNGLLHFCGSSDGTSWGK